MDIEANNDNELGNFEGNDYLNRGTQGLDSYVS